jgi:sugar phosphate isomerase/epimerase
MKLSFNTWPYASFPVWLPAYPLEETIKRLARIGYDGIEIGAASPHAYPPCLTDARRKEIKQVLEGEGIALSSMLPALSGGPGNNVASPIPEERRHTIEEYKQIVELCAYWGGQTVLYIPGWAVFGTPRKEALAWSREALHEIGEHAAGFGVRLAIEPTSYDSNLVDTADHAIELMDEVGLPNVKLMFDTFHVLYRREVLTDYAYRMGRDLIHIHISEERRMPPGHGRGDFESLIDVLKEIEFDGYVTMEIGFDRRDVEPDWFAREAYNYLKPRV